MNNLDGQDKNSDKAQLGSIMDAAREIHRAVDAIDALIAERLHVHRSDLRCLNLLEHGPLPASAIAAGLGLTSGSVTALVDRLEEAGFVTRRRSATDRRSIEIAIADSSFERIAVLYREVGTAIMQRFSAKSAAEIQQARLALQTFAEALRNANKQLSE